MSTNPRFDLTNRTVIVTGGGKGIGKVYAQEFARAGARVVAADIDEPAAKAVADALATEGLKALGLGVDIASEASANAMAQAALDRFGSIDVLINNASLMSVLPRRSWLEIPVEEWDRVMAVNLRGMFLTCRAVFPAMKTQQRGKIVNISSSRVFEGTPNRLHYTTSKAGVVGFTRALAREVGGFGITVNAVAPGITLSDTQVATSSGNYLGAHLAGRAIERPQYPEDLVGAVMFLSSAASDFMTGQTLLVDGGKSMHLVAQRSRLTIHCHLTTLDCRPRESGDPYSRGLRVCATMGPRFRGGDSR
jgi:3-oxoacyl-[acyl-carrier protein] reductase